MGWNQRQFKAFAKDIKDAYPGKAWSLLVDEMREAVLCERVLRVVLGQDKDAVKVADVHALYNGVREEMGQLGLFIDDGHKEAAMRVHAERKAKQLGIPDCARTMGCLCAFHARGGSPRAGCNASE